MLDSKIRKKLESLTQLPTLPYIASEVLSAVDNPNLSAASIASLIERDQAMTLKVLKVANSPFYGFSRKIATIDLAIVVMGLNTIKEIVLSLVVQKFFAKVNVATFDLKNFWDYSVFCGACSRLLARKLGYRLAGEAFVAGLMHDIGILILIQYFYKQFTDVRKLQFNEGLSLIDAEKRILNTTHCDIGAWLAERWNLPTQLWKSIQYHHSDFLEVKAIESTAASLDGNSDHSLSFASVEQPLTVIVSMTEWFAAEMGFKGWAMERNPSKLYLAADVLYEISSHDLLNPDSAINLLKQEIQEEYDKASIFQDMSRK